MTPLFHQAVVPHPLVSHGDTQDHTLVQLSEETSQVTITLQLLSLSLTVVMNLLLREDMDDYLGHCKDHYFTTVY